jgi:hypothetical protein
LPFGSVETLFTVQAENLGQLVDPKPVDRAAELGQKVTDLAKTAGVLIVCDSKRPTMRILSAIYPSLLDREGFRILSNSTKAIEAAIPDLKGRLLPIAGERTNMTERGMELAVPSVLLEKSRKVAIGTGEPDPLYGILDTKTALITGNVQNAKQLGYTIRTSDEPSPFVQTESYTSISGLADHFEPIDYATIIPKG